MSTSRSKLLSRIEQGRKGNNIGLSTGLSKLDKITYGIQRKSFILVGGDTGSGKSSLALYSYCYRPLMDAISYNKDVHILLF